MTVDDFNKRLAYFQRGALQRRNLFLWQGEEATLRHVLISYQVHNISMVTLLEGAPTLASYEAAATHLRTTLTESLSGILGDFAIVVLHECGILRRYVPDLGLLFVWLNSRRMIILLCPPLNVDRLAPVPAGLVIAPRRTPDALRKIVPAGHVVEVD